MCQKCLAKYIRHHEACQCPQCISQVQSKWDQFKEQNINTTHKPSKEGEQDTNILELTSTELDQRATQNTTPSVQAQQPSKEVEQDTHISEVTSTEVDQRATNISEVTSTEVDQRATQNTTPPSVQAQQPPFIHQTTNYNIKELEDNTKISDIVDSPPTNKSLPPFTGSPPPNTNQYQYPTPGSFPNIQGTTGCVPPGGGAAIHPHGIGHNKQFYQTQPTPSPGNIYSTQRQSLSAHASQTSRMQQLQLEIPRIVQTADGKYTIEMPRRDISE